MLDFFGGFLEGFNVILALLSIRFYRVFKTNKQIEDDLIDMLQRKKEI